MSSTPLLPPIIATVDRDYQLPVSNVIDPEIGPIATSEQLYVLLEKILNSFVYSIFGTSLREMNQYYYVCMGGKSINSYIKIDQLKKSFDFDIHMLDTPQEHGIEVHEREKILGNADYFGIQLASLMNKRASQDFPLLRYYLYRTLLKLGIVSINEKSYYENPAYPLFYYGYRSKTRFNIYGIFIRLFLQDDIFSGIKYYNVQYADEHPHSKNELCYPIADIDYEESLSFGLKISKHNNLFEINKYDEIRYSHFMATLFNLIKYLEKGGIKAESNFNKLQKFQNASNYTCNFISKYDPMYLYAAYTNLKNHVDPLILDAKLKSNRLRQYHDIVAYQLPDLRNHVIYHLFNDISLDKVIFTYGSNYDVTYLTNLENCKRNILLYQNQPNNNYIFNRPLDVDTMNKFFARTEYLMSQCDIYKIVYWYTGVGYNVINDFLEKNHNGIGMVGEDMIHIPEYFSDFSITLTDGTPIHFSASISPGIPAGTKIMELANMIDSCIRNVNHEYENNGILSVLNNTFYLYKIQNFMIVGSDTGNYFNPDILQKGSWFTLPYFMSTSYHTGYDYVSRLKSDSFVFRFKINKNSKYWAFINKYSTGINEYEVLLSKNLYYVVENISTMPIVHMRDGTEFLHDITVIDVVPFDDAITAIQFSAHLSNNQTAIGLGITPEIAISGGDRKAIENEIKVKYTNTLLFDNTLTKYDVDNTDNLMNDVSKYHKLLELINQSPKSPAYRTLNLTQSVIYDLNIQKENIFEMKKSKSFSPKDLKPTMVSIMPEHVMASQAGGDPYAHKYAKYKRKYLILKQQIDKL